jgi:hypothetical protein
VTRGHSRVRRRVAIAAAVIAFLVISAVVARWLQADNVERAKVERLLTAQVRGDLAGMRAELQACDSRCARLAQTLRTSGELEVVRYDSDTSHALGSAEGPTRVVWQAGDRLTTVQCIVVRRSGTAVTGPTVTLLSLSAPIGREASC